MNTDDRHDPGAKRPGTTPAFDAGEHRLEIAGAGDRSDGDKGDGREGAGGDRVGPESDASGEGSQLEEKPRRTFRRSTLEFLIIVVIAVVLAIFIQSFLVKAFIIPSSSMSPTLQIGDRVLVDRVTCYFRKPRRGDIIVFRYPPTERGAMNTTNPFYWPFEQIGETLHLAHKMDSPPYVKRVVATEGETVELRKGILYIDGKKIDEKYAVNDNDDFGPVKVPKGRLFVMGDNRANSRDSRFWGTVPIRSVIGRVFLIWWPPSRFGKPG